jgi:hypothetical protein
MVKITLKNISSWIGNDSIDNPFVTYISDKCKTDISFNKFLGLVLKQNILIFEKNQEDIWSLKSKQVILNQIDKSIEVIYNDHIINITKVQMENDFSSIIDIKHILDRLHLNLKKKLTDLYELKQILAELEIPIYKPELISVNSTNQIQQKILNKKKRIISNDIYIEEFSN